MNLTYGWIHCEVDDDWYKNISPKEKLNLDITMLCSNVRDGDKAGGLGLLKKYSEENKLPQEYLDASLLALAEAGNLEGFKYFVDLARDDLSLRSDCLKQASARGHLNIVKYLVEVLNIDINLDKGEALFEATKRGNLEVVKYLIKKGAKEPRKTSFSASAALSGNVDILKFLRKELDIDFHLSGECILLYTIQSFLKISMFWPCHAPRDKLKLVIDYLVQDGTNVIPTAIIQASAFQGSSQILEYLKGYS